MRTGQVWNQSEVMVWLVVGTKPETESYLLIDLASGEMDSVNKKALDEPTRYWKRLA